MSLLWPLKQITTEGDNRHVLSPIVEAASPRSWCGQDRSLREPLRENHPPPLSGPLGVAGPP